uniref:Uncharacterized protein n=1 Tax=Leersia perrieri TaxID=77586 RepID=A0A0D9XU02_9ORYZ
MAESVGKAEPPSIEEKREEALKVLHNLSEKLEDGGITDDRDKHFLWFMKMEVSTSVKALRMTHGVDSNMERWIDNLLERAREFEEKLDRRRLYSDFSTVLEAYGFYRVTGECWKNVQLPEPELVPQLPHAGHLVGIDGPAEEILKWLKSDDKRLQIKFIAGPSGSGKSTLAMEVLRRLRCCNEAYFHCYAVAKCTFNPLRRAYADESKVLQTIQSQIIDDLEEAPPSPSETKMQLEVDNLELLARNISERLQDKRYFIFIDNNLKYYSSDLEYVMDAFPNNNCGSRILLTSTSERTHTSWPFYKDDCSGYDVKPLNHSDAEKLLCTKAFGPMDSCPPGYLKLLLDEILMKCKRIPLHIIGLAEWFKQQQQTHEVSVFDVAEQARLRLEQLHGLPLQYPSYSIPLELSMFPQDYVVAEDDLMMKISDQYLYLSNYFYGLHSTKILTPVAEDRGLKRDGHDRKHWQINPFIMMSLATEAAKKGFAYTSTTLASLMGSADKTQIAQARRLALHHPVPELQEMLQQMDLFHTRSLHISSEVERAAVSLDKFAYLVVLDAEGWKNLKDEDILQICKMFMLNKLPPQIKELRHLRRMDVSHTHISELPLELCDLKYLWMLDLRGLHIRCFPWEILRLKYGMEHLLVGDAGAGSGIINSDHTALTKIPEEIYKLSTLKTLTTMDLSEFSASSVQSLSNLKYLKVLAITWSFHQSSNKAYRVALLSSIQSWEHLKSLTIHCGLNCSMEFLGSSLSDPPKELEKFKVTAGKFASVPKWIEGLEHLTFLQITVCKEVDVKILAGLEIVIESEGFKELQRFSLGCPLPWLTFQEGAMPKLTYLRLNLHPCPAIKKSKECLPSGITNLKMLSEIVLHYSAWYINSPNVKRTVNAVNKEVVETNRERKEVAETSQEIKEEVAEHRSPIDLFINGILVDVILADDEEAESATRFDQADAPKDGVQPPDEAEAPRTATQAQSEIEVEGEVFRDWYP